MSPSTNPSGDGVGKGRSILRRQLMSLVGMVLLPVLMASGALWVSSGAEGRLSRSEAAIVNLDEGASVGGDRMQLGQEYALALKAQDGPSFTWRYGVSVADAQEGLASGRYSASVVIPSGFSRVLTGTSDAGSQDRATLVVEQSPVSGVNDHVVFGQLSDAATRSLSSSVSRKYLDNIFVASTRVGATLGDASTAAQEAYLASGELQRQARDAQRASAELDRQAVASSRSADEAAAGSSKAASSAASLDAAGSRATTSPADAEVAARAEAAIKDTAAKAKGVQAAADKAKTSSETAAAQAKAAGKQGKQTADSSAAMARAAAANREAAKKYTGQVGAAASQQAELQQQLVEIQKSLDSYVKNVQVVTTAVQKTTGRTITEQSVPATKRLAGAATGQQGTGQQATGQGGLPRAISSREAAAPAQSAQSAQPAPSGPASQTTAVSPEAPAPEAPATAAPAPEAPAPEAPAPEATATAAPAPTSETAQPASPQQPAQQSNVAPEPATAQPQAAATRGTQEPAPQANENATTQPALVQGAGALGAQAIIAAPAVPAQQAPVQPAAPVDPVAQRDAMVKELKVAAGQLGSDVKELESLKVRAAATSTAAQQLQGAYDSLEKALPTGEVRMNNGVGAGSVPAACQAFADKAAVRACKAGYEAGYNEAVAKVVAALRASTVNARIDVVVEQTSATAKQVDGLQISTQQLAATLTSLADRLAALDLSADHEATPAPTATVTVTEPAPSQPTTPGPTSTVTVTAPPSSQNPSAPQESPSQSSPEPSSSGPSVPAPTSSQTPAVPELASREVTAALEQLNESSSTVSAQLSSLGETAGRSREALTEVGTGSDAAKDLTGGADAMNTAALAQADVVKQLQTSLSILNDGMTGLGTTMTGLQGQASSLGEDTGAISDNATRLATRAATLDRTIAELSTAAGQAATDAQTAASRSAELQRQISGLQQASGLVNGSTTAVAQDAREQTRRTQTVARKVSTAKADMPTYDMGERQRLTDVVGKPIDTAQSQQFRNVGWVSMLLLLSLWAGAMALHSALNPVSTKVRTSTARPGALLVQEMAPAATAAVAQALAVSAVGQAALHMSAGRWAAVTAVLVIASLTFAAINHSLVAFLRVFGRLVAAVCALVAGATILTRAYPPAMEVLRLLSPLTPAVETVRGVMTGAPGTVTSFLALMLWLAVGLVFSALAILRARNPEPVRVPTVRDE